MNAISFTNNSPQTVGHGKVTSMEGELGDPNGSHWLKVTEIWQ